MKEQGRRDSFARNTDLEQLLGQLNGALEQLPPLPCSATAPRQPLILIVGAPRSGTTLLSQWLASSGECSYPSNLISRFYSAPAIGALVQQMLFSADHQFRDEFHDLQLDGGEAFQSELGKTSGVLAPNEFWYFWRRFFPYGDIQQLPAEAFDAVDQARLLRELGEFEAVSGLPLAMKGMCFNWNLPQLQRLLPGVLFINVVREPVATAASLLGARERFYGDRSAWYSFRPPEYEWLQHRPVEEQVVGQVYFTRQAVAQGLLEVPAERQITVSYETFCAEPFAFHRQLSERLETLGGHPFGDYRGVKAFQSRSGTQADGHGRLASLYQQLHDRGGTPP